MLHSLCLAAGVDNRPDVDELVDEFEEKADISNPSLEFASSWTPLFIARFGKPPARLVSDVGAERSEWA